MTENSILITGIISAIIGGLVALVGHFISIRRLPVEKLTAGAAAKATEAGADKINADTAASLQNTIAKMQEGKTLLDNSFFDLRLQYGITAMEVERQKQGIETLTTKLDVSQTEATDWRRKYEKLELTVNGFPQEIARLEKLVEKQDATAQQIADIRQTDANTREILAKEAVAKANKPAELTGTTPVEPDESETVAVKIVGELLDKPKEN